MNNWRDHILKEFTPNISRLTLVADPDGLLLEEEILERIRGRGFELIPFEDHIAFRYAYESKFRSRWDQGEQTDLVVVLRSHASNLNGLPFDLLQVGRRLLFNLGDIFPNFSYPVVSALDRADLDTLYEAQNRYSPGQLGDNATKEFVLRHVFEIAPELIKQPSDLLRVLLQRHYKGFRIPNILDKRFIQLLRQNPTFKDWPLEKIIPDRETFFTFLQERWLIFLDREASKDVSDYRKGKYSYELTVNGPTDLPFDHHDIRIYIDNLFLEELLHPIPHEYSSVFYNKWIGIGIKTDPLTDSSRRIRKLIDNLKESIPVKNGRHTDWLHFAKKWAELIVFSNGKYGGIAEQTSDSIKELQNQVDKTFTSWLLKRYAGLINLPPNPPVMLHHLPRFLTHQIGENHQVKIALIVIDGLALDQWLVVRRALNSKQSNFKFREQSVFAWIPTLTSVSRQAIFAGKAPILFPNSIHTTNKEHSLWIQFWVDHGYTPNEVVFMKGLSDGILDNIFESLFHPKIRIAGLVIDKVDKIMHGMQMGTAGMHNQIYQWVQQSYLNSLIDMLLNQNFLVFITSDHGNIEAEGFGRPSEGSVADVRGERVRIYPDNTLRRQVKECFPFAIEWEPVGLPGDYLVLLAPARKAFIQKSQRAVCHGGISIEEIIVPLVQIERAEQL